MFVLVELGKELNRLITSVVKFLKKKFQNNGGQETNYLLFRLMINEKTYPPITMPVFV